MVFDRFARALPVLATAVALAGCVTIGPGASPTVPPTAAPPTAPPTTGPTTEPTTPPSDTQLDPNLTARYDEIEVDSGFAPDPMELSVVSGGPIDVRYLEGACVGFAEPNPDYEVHYTAGLLSMLRFYFVADAGAGDPTLIINDTTSNWLCSDDSFGGSNPSIEFSSPESGWYDIWIGSYQSGEFIPGTLFITELDSNHP
jgi:hypothetical protein